MRLDEADGHAHQRDGTHYNFLIPKAASTGRIRPDIAIENTSPEALPPNALFKRFKRLLDDSHPG
jgi:hypothetical protein